MKKLILTALAFLLLWVGSMTAKPAPDYFISKYDIMDLDFLRTHYTEINNGRPIQITGQFSSFKWLQPYHYQERLKELGFDPEHYNLVQLSLKEKDDYHYSFPILLLHRETGDLHELEEIAKDMKLVVYGHFYNMAKSEYAIQTDLIELQNARYRVNIKGTPGYEIWGHDRAILLDGRIPPTPTATPTVTPTPAPNLWQKVNNWINPKETGTPTGTVTPGT
ncbi:MAG TPA: hypothetical protein VHE12_08830 [bacterium]|nr:hypothetical protein [bacterium]